ncbi:MAG: hypothetical protein IPK69_09715 [Phycisphaerales bacterium]|nr:MAG: hypothetical protein IPK69_09715 [Phycisphaerales bacterium]
MARKRRQLALARKPDESGEPTPLGTPDEIIASVAAFNTAPDGGPARSTGMLLLHGPGLILELPITADTVQQVVVHMKDEDIAFPVLLRLCKTLAWQMIDLENGMTFGG